MPDPARSAAFEAFVSAGRLLAEARGLKWHCRPLEDGSIPKDCAWDLTAACGTTPPPVWRLNDLGYDRETLITVNESRSLDGIDHVRRRALSRDWQDLIKATVAHLAFAKSRTPSYVVNAAKAMRVLATCASIRFHHDPVKLSADDVLWAASIASEVQPSGKLGLMVQAAIRNVLDAQLLCTAGPFSYLFDGKQTETGAKVDLAYAPLASLSDRIDEEKLPDARAFWELADIVFTQTPKVFLDVIRFAQIRLLFLCGLRIVETSTIPADWLREREYTTTDGRPAGDVGGVSKALALRHFAAKQNGTNKVGPALTEAFQYVPTQFEQIIRSTLDNARTITQPLRDRLRDQARTGRCFPELALDSLAPLPELYTRLTGNPIIVRERPEELIAAYRTTFQPELLDLIHEHQKWHLAAGSVFDPSFQNYWARWQTRSGAPRLRSADGLARENARGVGLGSLFLRVAELEEWVARRVETKVSDTTPFPLAPTGDLAAHELLFVVPKRSLIEGRNGGITDVSRYFAVGRVTVEDVISQLSGGKNGLFARYGDTPEARAQTLNTHSLRHAQNTALFSAGLSDAIITKRYNRQSVAQSYVYDHRSLSEQLSAVSLPAAANGLPDSVRTVAKMIKSGRAKAPIADEFRSVQAARGEKAAFEYLAAEADGFHATPYGHCINGFTQEPCPKHLQCFGGCNHFVNTGLTSNRRHLEGMLHKLETALEAIEARKAGPGRDSQLRHAKLHLSNLRLLLASPEDSHPFANGPDLSRPISTGGLFGA